MRPLGLSAEAAALDVTDRAAVAPVLDRVGPVDVLVNSAGMARHGPALETEEADFDAVMAVNVKAAYVLAQEVARRMTGPGSIIQISSQMGHVGGIDRAVYCATKHAVEGMTKAMAIEWGPRGIRVNTICPTFIRTPLTEGTFADPGEARVDRKQDQARARGNGGGHHGGGRLPRLRRLGAGDGDGAHGRWRVDGGMTRSVSTPTKGSFGVAIVLKSGVPQHPAYQRSTPFEVSRIRRM
jgi:NAD(P)-dependent dehydrogenase (short-subunit alcohol dehydrogenase family)